MKLISQKKKKKENLGEIQDFKELEPRKNFKNAIDEKVSILGGLFISFWKFGVFILVQFGVSGLFAPFSCGLLVATVAMFFVNVISIYKQNSVIYKKNNDIKKENRKIEIKNQKIILLSKGLLKANNKINLKPMEYKVPASYSNAFDNKVKDIGKNGILAAVITGAIFAFFSLIYAILYGPSILSLAQPVISFGVGLSGFILVTACAQFLANAFGIYIENRDIEKENKNIEIEKKKLEQEKNTPEKKTIDKEELINKSKQANENLDGNSKKQQHEK